MKTTERINKFVEDYVVWAKQVNALPELYDILRQERQAIYDDLYNNK